VARVLYIVARDQPELFAFLREDFAAEEAEEVIEILMDRRQGAQPCEADRRDPRRKEGASVDLREMGFVFVRQQVPLLQRELPTLLANHQRELAATPADNRDRRERLEWQIKRVQKRMAEVEPRLAGG